jgi:hypothetical protein
MARTIFRERPPVSGRQVRGGGGDGPNDQTPIAPDHPAEIGTGLALVRGADGRFQKEIVVRTTHRDLLVWAMAHGAVEVKWVTPRLASEEQVMSERHVPASRERCTETCVTPGRLCDRETGECT